MLHERDAEHGHVLLRDHTRELVAETEADLVPCDPLEFTAAKAYTDQLTAAAEKSGLPEAVVTGTATIKTHAVVIGAMDFRFIGASMGSVVGEKITRCFEIGAAERTPVVLVPASGGARMQEGMLSLMQMAKTSAAIAKLGEAKVPFISVLADPTTGGTTASFAMLGDINVAEPQALIGFAGPRVIEQTIKEKLPKGFQRSEFLLEHGMLDDVIDRKALKPYLVRALRLFLNKPQ